MADDLKILVASHKPYWMPDDPAYLPVQVGAAGKDSIPGFQRDDEGDNISAKNPNYCELTALYWAWKNLDAGYVGLAHYRRHFAGGGERGIVTGDELEALLGKSPVVLPKRRRYCIETVEAHYGHTFDPAHLDVVRSCLGEYDSTAVPFLDAYLAGRSGHVWNMMVMRRDVLDTWCSWLFPLLERVEECIDFEGLTPFERRVTGRLSERLIDPWLNSRGISYVEQPVVSLEREDWLKKGSAFLAAKFLGKKYKASF